MERLLVLSILSVGFLFLAFTVAIVTNKAWRETREAWRRARRRRLEPRVLTYAHGDHPSLRAVLGGEYGPADRGVLEETLLDIVQRVRGIERDRIRQALDEMGYVDRWIRRLDSARWWTRANAAENLGLAGASRAVDALVGRLDDDTAEVRIRAAKSLGVIGGTAGVRPLIQALDDPSRWSTIRISDILAEMGHRVQDEMVTLFPHLGLHGRLAVLDVLARIHSLDAAGWLRLRLTDPHADVRARAAHALGALGDTDSGPALVEALGDREWPVRAMAAKALGRLRRQDAVGPLTGALRDREWWVRANSAEALRAVGPKGIEALQKMLDDRDTFARHQAVVMLQESGVLDAQIEVLAGPDGPERRAAEGLIRRLIGVGQLGRIRELALGHPQEGVRAALRRLLDESGRATAEVGR